MEQVVTRKALVVTSGLTRMAIAGAALALAIACMLPDQARAATVPFKEVRMIIEFNSTAEDIGIQFFLDSEGWKSVDIFAPKGNKIFSATAQGALLTQGGGTELFVESVEPPLDELPLDEFFARFPEGEYLFTGRMPGGVRLVGAADFDHDVPAGPEIVSPGPGGDTCTLGVGIPAVIAWNPVTETIEGEPIEIVGYEVIVENDHNFDVHLPGDATQVTVPAEFLEPGTDYIFEVLAIGESGNQTITEGCFSTAP